MLFSPVFVVAHPRSLDLPRTSHPRFPLNDQTFGHSDRSSIVFVERRSQRGRDVQTFSLSLSPLSATLIDLPASVANKRLTATRNPLDATLTKNGGHAVQAKCAVSTPNGVTPIALSNYLQSSVHTSKFRIPQVLCLPLLRKHRGCGGILPILELAIRLSEIRPDRRFQTLRPSVVQRCSCPPVTGRISRASQVQSGCWPPLCFFKVTDGHAPKQDHSVSRVPVPFSQAGNFKYLHPLAKSVECLLPFRAFLE
jgi:hypothetical protein